MKKSIFLAVLFLAVFNSYAQHSQLKVNSADTKFENQWFYELEASDKHIAFSFTSGNAVVYLDNFDYGGAGTYTLKGNEITIEIEIDGGVSRYEGIVQDDQLKLSQQFSSQTKEKKRLIFALKEKPSSIVTMPDVIQIPDEEEEIEVELDNNMIGEDDFEFPEEDSFNRDSDDDIYSVVDIPAKPVDGYKALNKSIYEQLKYPVQAKRMGIEGVVFVAFIVEIDGQISEVQAIRGIGAGCDQEAERIIRNMADWKPASHKGNIVRHKNIVPVKFQIDDEEK